MKLCSSRIARSFVLIAATLATAAVGITASAHACPPAEYEPAEIEALRKGGLASVLQLCGQLDRLDAGAEADQASSRDDALALRSLIARVAGQYDAHVSRLFWHTDFQSASDEARHAGKPILSLRLLGRLDEDLSCANSRFFRSVLYANEAVSDYLRDHFVLHWESLRPVPTLTIDFGDGRRLERTITGNSIHYILDAEGEIIDALPGLYGPGAFLRHLEAAETIHRQSRMMHTPQLGRELIRQWHAASVVRLEMQLREAREHYQAATGLAPAAPVSSKSNVGAMPLAVPAAQVAISKMRVEHKVVEAALDQPGAFAAGQSPSEDEFWAFLASRSATDAMLDERSTALILAKMPRDLADDAQNISHAKRIVESPSMRAVRLFQQSLAIDTVRNEHQLHLEIHRWLADGASRADDAHQHLSDFNRRVYAELFLTPLDDPWMGLAPAHAYSALDHGGLIDLKR